METNDYDDDDTPNILRSTHREKFTTVSNHVITGTGLSARAKWLHIAILSKPDRWVFRLSHFTDMVTEGRDAMRSAWKELIGAGYVRRIPRRGEGGLIRGWITLVSENQIFLKNPDGGDAPGTDFQADGEMPEFKDADFQADGKPGDGFSGHLVKTDRSKDGSQSKTEDIMLDLPMDDLEAFNDGAAIAEHVEAIYEAYPRKVAAPAGRRAIAKAIKGGADPPTLLRMTKHYAKIRLKTDPGLKFTPHPATWFGQERFSDDPMTWGSTDHDTNTEHDDDHDRPKKKNWEF